MNLSISDLSAILRSLRSNPSHEAQSLYYRLMRMYPDLISSYVNQGSVPSFNLEVYYSEYSANETV